MFKRRDVLGALGALGVGAWPAVGAQAADAGGFPSRPVKIVVGFPAGGSSDSAARIIAEPMTAEWGQPVIVDNKPGAGATIAAAQVAAAPPDGYTLLLVAPGTHAVSAAVYPNLPYDPLRSFQSIGQVATAPFFVLVNGDSPYKTLGDLVSAAKAHPNKLSYGSSGNGAGPHLIAASICQSAGIQCLHVPYKGAAAATLGLIGKQVDFAVADMSALPHIKSGKLRAVAVTTAQRASNLPDVPTLAEAGVPGVEYTLTVGLVGPAGIPQDVVHKINQAVARALKTQEAQQKLAALGYQGTPTTPEVFAASMASDMEKFGKVVAMVGLKRQ